MDSRLVFHIEKTPTAKKEHKCCECKGTIKPGEKYSYFFGVWDEYGSGKYAIADKTCLECEKDWGEVLDAFHNNGEEDAIHIFGMLKEAIQDAFDAGFLEESDRLVKEWLDIEAEESEVDAESLSSEERDNRERQEAVAQMRVNSTPLL